MLDQLELLEELTQVGVIVRGSVTYKDGERVTDRGWHDIFTRMNGTFLNYILMIRLKYSEEIIQEAYVKLGGHHLAGWELKDILHGPTSGDPYRVKVSISHVSSGIVRTLNR